MRHALMNPAYPDIVRQSAIENLANDNVRDESEPPGAVEVVVDHGRWNEALFQLAAQAELEANRLW